MAEKFQRGSCLSMWKPSEEEHFNDAEIRKEQPCLLHNSNNWEASKAAAQRLKQSVSC